jgi:hypothetical protein
VQGGNCWKHLEVSPAPGEQFLPPPPHCPAGHLGAHNLFLKLDGYLVSPGATLVVRVLNGTFSTSEAGVG